MSTLKPLGSGIFSTKGCPLGIVCAGAFHFRVRNENGWFHPALTTKRLSYFNTLSSIKKEPKPQVKLLTPSPFIPLPLGGEGGRKKKEGLPPLLDCPACTLTNQELCFTILYNLLLCLLVPAHLLELVTHDLVYILGCA